MRAESDTVAPTPAGRGPRPEPRTAHPPAAAMIVFESSSEAPPSGRSPDVVWFTPHWPEPTAAQPDPPPEPPVAAQPDPPPEPTLLPEPVAGLDLRDLAADDQLLQLLFADLAPTRRSRRRGPRCIPDFDPIHLDDEFSLLRR